MTEFTALICRANHRQDPKGSLTYGFSAKPFGILRCSLDSRLRGNDNKEKMSILANSRRGSPWMGNYKGWIPACAGMTMNEGENDSTIESAISGSQGSLTYFQ
jgi:hypothetical protein